MHLKRGLALSLGMLPMCSSAFSWNKEPAERAALKKNKFFWDEESLPPDTVEVAAITRNAELLQSYDRKPDCFRRAAGLIQTRCSELDMDEDERVKAAISMTLCELGTAQHHSAPLECADFDPNSRYADPRIHSSRACVEALSRSAQYWSSYSGYLREVSQLCYAFRRWNDIDLARDLYKNATLENLALLQHVVQREKHMDKHQQQSEQFLQVILALRLYSHLDLAAAQDVRVVLGDFRSASTDVVSAYQDVVQLVSNSFEESFRYMQEAVTKILQNAEHEQSHSVSRIDQMIGSLVEQHALSLEALVPSFERSLYAQLEHMISNLAERFEGVLVTADATRWQLLSVTEDVTGVQRSVENLAATVVYAEEQLVSQLEQTQRVHSLQIETAESAARVADALSGLTIIAREEMKNISDVAADLREGLFKGVSTGMSSYLSSLGKATIFYIFEIVLRVDPLHVEHAMHLPVFRALAMAGHLASLVVRASFSSLMSIVVLLASLRRWSQVSVNTTPDPERPYDPQESAYPALFPVSQGPARRTSRLGPGSASFSRPPQCYRARISRIPDRLYNSTDALYSS
ncbi:uncharacterized protein LAESUDRAFT_423435 [Laetiporus sulphureus 93-53]|uniref:Nuclear fusion protein KAR5 n=1 Tax=Laetiporus sulphureus 93-53 TaxID=1314785 RepID=A0A165GIC7_9APHY|nr:uncharacterized protein LAESUDRAFT_423435 [Laetiporus sulphureus 93-53]KZT10389.1 hypothetical protein LAESUDRAFT_423435 [Laetiporus sulphureus 93-53]